MKATVELTGKEVRAALDGYIEERLSITVDGCKITDIDQDLIVKGSEEIALKIEILE